jgi:tellurite methyltransferase
MTYDRTYKNTENVFGTNPEIILKKYANKIEKARPVLDIGIGQGRNSFYLAKEGFKVDGLSNRIS